MVAPSKQTEICYLSLGSNRGNRLRNIASALRRLSRLTDTRLGRVSRIYETTPVGVQGQGDYLNCCAEVRTSLSPMGLLVALKGIEASLGRKPAARWAARNMDIDILFYGEHRIKKRFLTIPHPRALRRRFVLAPLAELKSAWAPPALRRAAIRRWLLRLNAPSQNVRVYARRRT